MSFVSPKNERQYQSQQPLIQNFTFQANYSSPTLIFPPTMALPSRQFSAHSINGNQGNSSTIQTIVQNRDPLRSNKIKRIEDNDIFCYKKPRIQVNLVQYLLQEFSKGPLNRKNPLYGSILENMQPEDLPMLLTYSLDNAFPELTWDCFLYGIKQGKPLIKHEALNESRIDCTGVKLLINALKGLIKCPLINLNKELGEVTLDLSQVNEMFITPKELSWFSFLAPLSEVTPLTLRCMHEIENHESPFPLVWLPILQSTYMITKLVASSWYVGHGEIEKIKQFPNIKSFGTFRADCFESMDDVYKYLEQLKPITPYVLNLENIPDHELTDEVLDYLAMLAPDLKELIIKNEHNITHCPFKNLKWIIVEDVVITNLNGWLAY